MCMHVQVTDYTHGSTDLLAIQVCHGTTVLVDLDLLLPFDYLLAFIRSGGNVSML